VLLGSCAQAPSALQQIRARGELRVVTLNLPTCYYLGAQGPEGLEYDLASRFAAQLGVRLQIYAVPNEAAIRSELASGHADIAALRAKLTTAAPNAILDDHQLWLDRLAHFARSAELTAIAILVLIGGVAVISVSFATRAGLAVHRDTIELLHLMGARDGYVARQFERQALRLALIGGVAGLVLATAALLALSQATNAAAFLGDSVTLLPALHLRGWNWAVLAALPIVAGLVAMATARLTVLTTLRRLP